MFSATKEPILPTELEKQIKNPRAGALVTFEGWVRDHNEGQDVSSLEYEIYESLATKEAAKIIQEAKEKYDILDITATHREGHMQIGEIAVWIGVTSKHREAAFRACRFVIDEIKLRLPIWKKEHYVNGKAEWVNCQGCYKHAHTHYSEDHYYEKQLPVLNGKQELLKNSKVLVIGAGGLGCPALSYLTGAGVGSITICDGDRLEISNLHRQILYSHADIGEYKSVLAKKRLKELNPFINIEAFTDRIDISNALELISKHDLVLDCTDNFESKFIIHDACYLSRKPLVQASIYQNDGQLQTFSFTSGSSCMRCLWPTMPDSHCVGNCAEVGVLGVVPGVLGTMQAAEAIKTLTHTNKLSFTHTLLVDLSTWDISKIKRTKSKTCPLCGEAPSIINLNKIHYGHTDCDLELSTIPDSEIINYNFIDIRELNERNLSSPWENILTHIPSNQIDSKVLQKSKPRILLVCQKGIRSRKLATTLRNSGLQNVYSLNGGVASLHKNWDRIQKLLC